MAATVTGRSLRRNGAATPDQMRCAFEMASGVVVRWVAAPLLCVPVRWKGMMSEGEKGCASAAEAGPLRASGVRATGFEYEEKRREHCGSIRV